MTEAVNHLSHVYIDFFFLYAHHLSSYQGLGGSLLLQSVLYTQK